MYISMKDSTAAGFKKWSAARPNTSTAESPELSREAAPSAGDDTASASIERPHGPWLVPGPGTL